jgi:hypothetical protein
MNRNVKIGVWAVVGFVLGLIVTKSVLGLDPNQYGIISAVGALLFGYLAWKYAY